MSSDLHFSSYCRLLDLFLQLLHCAFEPTDKHDIIACLHTRGEWLDMCAQVKWLTFTHFLSTINIPRLDMKLVICTTYNRTLKTLAQELKQKLALIFHNPHRSEDLISCGSLKLRT